MRKGKQEHDAQFYNVNRWRLEAEAEKSGYLLDSYLWGTTLAAKS